MGLSAFSSQPTISVQNAKRVSRKIVAVMAPQQSERSPATTGSVGFCLLIVTLMFLLCGFEDLMCFNGGFCVLVGD